MKKTSSVILLTTGSILLGVIILAFRILSSYHIEDDNCCTLNYYACCTGKYLDGILDTKVLSRWLHMTGHGLALVLVGEALVGVAHVLGGVLQGERLLPR